MKTNKTKDEVAFGNFQSKLQAWMFWDSQSTEYKLKHSEPPKPLKESPSE